MAARVGEEDFVVGGWDNVSILYGDIWAGAGKYMDFTSEAVSMVGTRRLISVKPL